MCATKRCRGQSSRPRMRLPQDQSARADSISLCVFETATPLGRRWPFLFEPFPYGPRAALAAGLVLSREWRAYFPGSIALSARMPQARLDRRAQRRRAHRDPPHGPPNGDEIRTLKARSGGHAQAERKGGHGPRRLKRVSMR